MGLTKDGLRQLWANILVKLDERVEKVDGKGLSTNDYTTEEKNKLTGIEVSANHTVVDSELSSTSTNPVENKAIYEAISGIETSIDGLVTEAYVDEATQNIKADIAAQDTVVLSESQAYTDAALTVANDYTDEQISSLTTTVETNYDETIIALSVDGTTVTYIKGDGSVHTFETQDTNTTYSLGTDSVTGLTKLYATTGNAEDGTMTQKAIKTELDKKVGVTMDDANHTLIFTK